MTADDVERVLQTRRASFPEDEGEARRAARDQLIAELSLAARYDDAEDALSPEVREALADARRQVLFNAYAQSRFTPGSPDDADSAAFVAARGDEFADRQEVRYLRVILQPEDTNERRAVRSAVDLLQDGEATEETLSTAADRLDRTGVPVLRQPYWGGLDALPSGDRARVEAMIAEDRALDVVERPQGYDVLLLSDVRAAPLDPAMVGPQIAGQLQFEEFRAFQTALAADLAAPYLSGEASGAAPALPSGPRLGNRALAGLIAFGFGAGLAGLMGLRWILRAISDRHEVVEMGQNAPRRGPLDHPGAAWLGTLVALGLVAGGAAVLSGSLPIFTLARQVAVLAGGGAVVGLVTALIYGASAVSDTARPTAFAWPTLLGAAVCVAVALVVGGLG